VDRPRQASFAAVTLALVLLAGPALDAGAVEARAAAGKQLPAVSHPPAAVAQREAQLRRIEQLQRTGKRADARRLLPLLKDPDAEVRERAEHAIWSLWGRSGQAVVDRLFRNGVAQMGRREINDAIETFTIVVDTMPGFAEAYNKRATARFLAGDLVGAMDDCQRALDLEPDHFGSLAGYGHIYFRLDDMDMAILYWRRALAVNPNLASVARSIDAAERILRGRGRLQT
jgi:tetratricopeptide (TPR) repeat protein